MGKKKNIWLPLLILFLVALVSAAVVTLLVDFFDDIFVYKYDLPSFLSYYKILNMTQFAKYADINPSLMRQYKQGQYVSEKQVAKIQTAINKIGRELAAVQLL
ncbi:MAG: hypothetical protein J6W84_01790 [Bacteroidales bacterium]|nr:hypothetical protein [Bacteroidales bacterium]